MGQNTASMTRFFFFFFCFSLCVCLASLFCLVFGFPLKFGFNLLRGRPQEQRASVRRQGNKWGEDAWWEIHKESIKVQKNKCLSWIVKLILNLQTILRNTFFLSNCMSLEIRILYFKIQISILSTSQCYFQCQLSSALLADIVLCTSGLMGDCVLMLHSATLNLYKEAHKFL